MICGLEDISYARRFGEQQVAHAGALRHRNAVPSRDGSGPAVRSATMSVNSFGARDTLTVADTLYTIYRLDRLDNAERLPYGLKVLLENVLRNEDGRTVTTEQIQALIDWDPAAEPSVEIQFTPARVLMQDFTGVRGHDHVRWRPGGDQSLAPGRVGDRPFRDRGLLWSPRGV
jgi:hypothetical protein